MSQPSPLESLAERHGVATSYLNWAGERQIPPESTVRRALEAMGVPASSDAEIAAALEEAARRERSRFLPDAVVLRQGDELAVTLSNTDGAKINARLFDGEDGLERDLRVTGADPVMLQLPADLETGHYRLRLGGGDREQSALLLLAPRACPGLPPAARLWGWMVQLYALRSRSSWGMGDLGDLAGLSHRSGRELGADFVLVNPLHAVNPSVPQQSSPYYPSSRRFRNPLYLRIEDVPEFSSSGGTTRAELERLAEAGRALNALTEIERDRVYELKLAALELLARQPRGRIRQAAFEAYRAREGRGLLEFATFSALAERHGVPFQDWPRELRQPGGAGVAAARRALARRVKFHEWLQWLCEEQTEAAQSAATEAGMAVGVIHDLAVGVDAGGADAWALQDALAEGFRVGAPPDSFNQRGQDWGLPPLRPDSLAGGGLDGYRAMLRSTLRHAGGIRIDHAPGLFRLFWVPLDGSPADGTYVSYPAGLLLGTLAIEANRAGAIVVAEDLGTVSREMRRTLRDWGIFGSAVLWFERGDDEVGDRDDADEYRSPSDYPRQALASVTTHDLPAPAGYWAGQTLEEQERLGLLGDRPVAEQRAERARDRKQLLELLISEGLAKRDSEPGELLEAIHAVVARAPSALVAIGLADALGETRQPNLPGTLDEYPNWRQPLARLDAAGQHVPVLLEQALEDPVLLRVVEAVRAERRASSGATDRRPS